MLLNFNNSKFFGKTLNFKLVKVIFCENKTPKLEHRKRRRNIFDEPKGSWKRLLNSPKFGECKDQISRCPWTVNALREKYLPLS